MPIRDILVHVDHSAAGRVRLGLAAGLARDQQARLTALYCRDRSVTDISRTASAQAGLVPAEEFAALGQRLDAAMDRAEAETKAAFDSLPRGDAPPPEWRRVEGSAAALVPQHARYADLCVVGRDPGAESVPGGHLLCENVLFLSGRPVLIVPPGYSGTVVGRNVAVAWNASRVAARALADALPLLSRATTVTVIAVDPEEYTTRRGAPAVPEIGAYLERQGIEATMRTRERPSGGICATLCAEARDAGADLLVAGAYGHPRLWEMMLGGVTRELLYGCDMPLMMSY